MSLVLLFSTGDTGAMALQQMVFSARLVDSNGRSRACHAYYSIDDGITVATLLGHLEGFGSGIQNISDGLVKSLSVSIADRAWVPTAVNNGGAPIEQTGVLNFNATGSPRRWGLAIPAISNHRLIGDHINLPNEDVAILIAILTGGNYTNDHGQALTTFADAIVSFRRDRKQLQRASFET